MLTDAAQEKAGFMTQQLLVPETLEPMIIALKTVNFQRYPDSRSAILAGAVDIGATRAPQVIQDLANGIQLRQLYNGRANANHGPARHGVRTGAL